MDKENGKMTCRECRKEIRAYKGETLEDFVRRKEKEFRVERGNEKPVSMKSNGRVGKNLFVRESWKFIPQCNIGHRKVFLIERLRYVKTEGKSSRHTHRKKGEIEYRIGYFVIGKKGNRKNLWTWGQFCPLIPQKDIRRVCETLRKLKPKKGT